MTDKSWGDRAASRGEKPIIGWKEWVSFPALGVAGIRSKVDTGARTSALHATNMREFDVDGATWVGFTVHCEHESKDEEVSVELPLIDRRPVRDSSGREEVRPVVRATLDLGGERWQIEVTLTRRDDMEFNMLLGRRAVRGRFLIDPKREYILGVPGVSDTPKKKSPTGKMARKKTRKRKTPTRKQASKRAGKKTTSKKRVTSTKAIKKKPAKGKPSARKTAKRKTPSTSAADDKKRPRKTRTKKSSPQKAVKSRTSPKKETRS